MIALLMAAALAQGDPASELRKEVEALLRRVEALEAEHARLDRENQAMRGDVEKLRTFSVEAALKLAALRPEPPPPALLRCRVLAVDAEYAFLIIDRGEDHGLREGWTGDVLRPLAEGRYERLGSAAFEKFVEIPGHRQTKMKVTDGAAARMKYGDLVVDNRHGDPKAILERAARLNVPVPAPKETAFRITGCTDTVWFVDCGRRDGLKSGSVVTVVRNGDAVARLKLGKVADDWAEASLEPGSEAPAIGDALRLVEPPKAIVGRVKHNSAEHGICLDFGIDTGARPGFVFEIKRDGKPAGRLRLTSLQKGVAFAEPVGDLDREAVRLGDFVEWLPDSRH